MKNIFLLLFSIISLSVVGQTTCGGTINLQDVPVRTSTTLASALEIGDGGAGQITVCIKEQHTDGKCGGTKPTLYIIYDNGSGTEAFYQIWTMEDVPTGTCITFPLCGEPLYLKRTSCINNDGSPTQIEWYYTNYQGGDYKNRCTNTVLTTNPITDCANATQVCDTGTYAGNAFGPGIQEIGCSAPSGNDDGCLSGENNSAWYYFEAQTSGTVTFSITPATNKDDYDFALWGPNPTCTNLGSPVRCNFALNKGPTGLNSTATVTEEDNGCVSGAGCTNTGFSSQLNVNAGEVYYLLVDGYLTATDPNYTIAFGGTASILCPGMPMSLGDLEPIKIKEENMSEPLKIKYRWNTSLQMVDSTYKGIQIIMYEDGTRDRIIKW
jgi:hypothetical protein